MRYGVFFVTFACALLGLAPLLCAAASKASFSRQVRPFFVRYCVECHNPKTMKAGLDLETYESLMEGADSGPVLVAAKPDESRMVRLTEHKDEPFMPPRKSRQPKTDELRLLRAWIAAGAKNDAGKIKGRIPDIKPRVPVHTPITALAYRPGGKLLAAGGKKQVIFIDLRTGEVLGRLGGQAGQVTALAFSSDGKRLAVASGVAAASGEIRIYKVAETGVAMAKADHVLQGHKDLIHEAVFSPDNALLATCSYDRLVKLWNPQTGKEIRTLKDHSDAVYGLTFSPDGRLLASGSADRAIKVWDAATGKRLYTLGESTDWVYTLAWSPDGRHLAGAGVDKSIRVWRVSASAGKLVNSVFAHEGPITRLIYNTSGETLYSVGEDRVIKNWVAGRLVERKVYGQQPETVLALAVSVDRKQIALGRYDGTLVLLDEATGKVISEPLPLKPKPPQLTRMEPATGQAGKTIRFTFWGKHLEEVNEITAPSGVTSKVLSKSKSSDSLEADITFPAGKPAGIYKLGLKSPLGPTAQLPFTLDLFAPVTESEPNDSPTTGQKIALPSSISGSIAKPGDVDYYRFEADKGQEIGVQVLTAAVGSALDPVLRLTDASGKLLADSNSGLLGFTCPKAGVYALGIRDREFRGGARMHYRLHIGTIPMVTGVFPLGLERGTTAEIHLQGVHLGKTRSIRVKAPATAEPGTRLPVPVTVAGSPPLGNPSVVVGEFPELVSGVEKNRTLAVPGTANGRIVEPGATQTWRFAAKKGRRLVVEINARRLGSPLDSIIEILDARGRVVRWATLRCLAKTYTTFRDHDSVGTGIRIESWSELAVNDYLLVGSELLRIRELPKNPDDDCQFFGAGGRRLGYFGTTPTHHSLGAAMYKVSIHPPGTTFPPNGLPVVHLDYRNDDGGPGYGKDSCLFFDPPADGEYQVRVGDSRGEGGRGYAYRLTVRPPRPHFSIAFTPTAPAVWKGGAIPITVSAERMDGFDGAIDVHLENLPSGFSAPATSIPAGENATTFALWADTTATNPVKVPPLKLVARAVIEGKKMVQEAKGGQPRVVEPGDLVTSTERSEVAVQAGKQVRLLVKIERRGGFKGRVPLDVRGLPHGVRVLDIGLNGILITERETSRTIVIYAEPWVKPMMHPFVVLSRSERKGTEHAAKSVLLKVVAGAKTGPK
jgi:WD40 repeat protein